MKKRKILIVLLAVLLSLTIPASRQNINADTLTTETNLNLSKKWDITLGQTGYASIEDIVGTEDGGFIVVGSVMLAYPVVGVVVKYDANKNIEWTSGYGMDNVSSFNKISELSTGGYVIVGSGYGGKGTLGDVESGVFASFVAKIDESGNLLDAFLVSDTTGGMDNLQLTNVSTNQDGGFTLTGSAYRPMTNGIYGDRVFIVQHYDANNNLLWDNNSDSISSFSSDLIELSDQRVAVGGALIDTPTSQDNGYRLAIFSKSGEVQSDTKLISPKGKITSIKKDDDDNIYAFGLSYNSELDVFQSMIMKFDNYGSLVWSTTLGEEGINESSYDGIYRNGLVYVARSKMMYVYKSHPSYTILNSTDGTELTTLQLTTESPLAEMIPSSMGITKSSEIIAGGIFTGDWKNTVGGSTEDGDNIAHGFIFGLSLNTPPTLELSLNASATVGDTIDLKTLFEAVANDDEDGVLTSNIVIDDSRVDYTREGSYTVIFSITDSDNNTVQKEVTLTLNKKVNPSIIYASDHSELIVGSNTDLKILFEVRAEDGDGNDITDDVLVDDSLVNYATPGDYKVSFYLETTTRSTSPRKEVTLTIIDTVKETDTTKDKTPPTGGESYMNEFIIMTLSSLALITVLLTRKKLKHSDL